MSAMASQITSLLIIYSTVCSGTDHREHQSSVSLAFVREIHRWTVNSPHKGPVMRKMFPFDDMLMWLAMSYYVLVQMSCTPTFQGCFTGTFTRLLQWQWSNPEVYGLLYHVNPQQTNDTATIKRAKPTHVHMLHYSGVTWASCHLKSQATRLFNSLFRLKTNKHQNPRYWPFVKGIYQWLVVSLKKGQYSRKRFYAITLKVYSPCVQSLRSRRKRSFQTVSRNPRVCYQPS